MILGVVEHIKCGEWSGERTLAWMPDDWTPERFREAVFAAQTAYLAFLKDFRKSEPPHGLGPYSHPEYEKHPDQTVAEVKAQFEKDKADYDEWDKQQQLARRTFGDYLEEQGLTPMWRHKPEHFVELDWGHHHGWGLEWNPTEPKDLKGLLDPPSLDW